MYKKKVLAGVLALCACIAVAAGYFGLRTVAKDGQVIGCDIEATYDYGKEFEIPDGKVGYQEEEKEAESRYLVFPSGKANESAKVTLSEYGEYQVVYKARFGGAMVSAKKTFLVNKKLFAVSGETSMAEVVDDKISVSLAPEDVFTYNKALNLTEASLENPLITLEMSPKVIGTADAENVIIRFTDIYNEDNYVTLTVKNYPEAWANGQVYITAGASTQPQIGLENVEDSSKTNIHKNDIFGTPVYFSMVGIPNSSMDQQLKIYFDYENKAFYVDREIYSGGQKRIIVDLDDSRYFGSDIWEGFTTGEVKMTITAGNYQAPSCNFFLAQVNGEMDFSAEGDSEAPVITIDSGYEDDDLPDALVGKPYKLFAARAFDEYDGETSIVSAAYYKYFSATPVKLFVDDGAFIPEKEGNYVIEYTSTDVSGNVAVKYAKIKAVEGEGLQLSLKDAAAETFTGVGIPVISGISYEGNSGRVDYFITAKNESTGEEVAVDAVSREFCPMSDGDWKITVIASDYVSTVEKSFALKSNHTTQPQVYGSTSVQKYFISGATYQLPELSGYDFSGGTGVETAMDIFVTESGSEEKQLTDGKYIPEKTGEVAVTYRLTVDGKSCEKTYMATIVDVGYKGELNLDQYFVATEGQATAEKSATSVTYATKAPLKLDFINFVQVKDLTFSFQVGEENHYDRVNMYLTDTVSGKQVKLSYKRSGEKSVFCINDGTEYDTEASFGGMDRNFALEFGNDTHMVSVSGVQNLKIDKFLDGSNFEGFTDSLALFAVELEDVTGASQLVVNNLNGQSFNNTKADRFAPQIIVETKAGDRGIGEEVELKGAFVYDTLDPVSSLTLVVTGPNNECVKDKNGVILDGTQDASKDYCIALEDYGDYTIQYTSVDGTGKTDEYVYAITSKDAIGPEIALKKHKTTAKKDAEVKVAEAEVKDNITKECTLAVYVFGPDGVSAKVNDGKFKATTTGVWTVRYMAYDESGNYAFASYEIVVK